MRTKSAGSTLDYPINWALAAGETISTSVWAVDVIGSPHANALAVQAGSPSLAGATTACLLTGGASWRRYRVRNTIQTSQGRADERSILFIVASVETTP